MNTFGEHDADIPQIPSCQNETSMKLSLVLSMMLVLHGGMHAVGVSIHVDIIPVYHMLALEGWAIARAVSAGELIQWCFRAIA